MSTEKTTQDFKFESTLLAVILAKCFGLMLVWVSFDTFLIGWLNPSWDRLPYMIILLPFGLFLWAVAGVILYGYCYIQILDGQFRFLRFFTWTSLPLESITRMRVSGHGIYLRLDHAGKRYQLIFAADNFRLGPSPAPVVQFLREVCSRNAANSESRP